MLSSYRRSSNPPSDLIPLATLGELRKSFIGQSSVIIDVIEVAQAGSQKATSEITYI